MGFNLLLLHSELNSQYYGIYSSYFISIYVILERNLCELDTARVTGELRVIYDTRATMSDKLSQDQGIEGYWNGYMKGKGKVRDHHILSSNNGHITPNNVHMSSPVSRALTTTEPIRRGLCEQQTIVRSILQDKTTIYKKTHQKHQFALTGADQTSLVWCAC